MSFFNQFKHYNKESFKKDLIAGLIVGVIAIPLGMAFAIAIGVKPEYGIYSTIIAGLLVTVLGGSRFQIAGPTGAFIPILLGVTIQYGFENLLIAGFMAGVMLLLMGLFRIGSYIKFIPRSVIVGFTSGIAIIIFTGQIGNFLGLEGLENREFFIDNIMQMVENIGTLNIYAIIIALISFALILITPKFFPKVPGTIVSIVITTLLAVLFLDGKLATIGSEFGGLSSSLPSFKFPDFTLQRIATLFQPALVIAALGAIESLLSCVVADGMTDTRHDSNRELIGQGIANMVVPFFGGIPATGALARTATNINAGAVTSLSGIIHVLVVLAVLLLFAPLASYIPLASMAPVLMIVAWNMSNISEFRYVFNTTRGDAIVLVITFMLTVFVNVTVAVQVGLILAFGIFVKNLSDVQEVKRVQPDFNSHNRKMSGEKVSGRICPQISIFTIEGPLFFGIAQLIETQIMDKSHSMPKMIILRMTRVPFLDATGENYLDNLVRHFQAKDSVVVISGIKKQPLKVMKRSGLYDRIGKDNFYKKIHQAITASTELIDLHKCNTCTSFAFNECKELSNMVKEIS
ncbi:MAG TPA: SulP family inorganic anion transporter [Syntrophomonadaceae bacterium]|nr:SulP family inorganic anion transporter [Syntrophomonadaceae bacterium]